MTLFYLAGLLIALIFVITIAIHLAVIVYSTSKLRPYIFLSGIPLYLILWGIHYWFMTILSLAIIMIILFFIKKEGTNIGKDICIKISYFLLIIIVASLLLSAIFFLKGFSAWIDNIYADLFSRLFS